MSLDAINSVTRAEAEAEAVRAEYDAMAKKLLADTEAAGKAALEKRRREAETENSEKLAKAGEAAAADCDAILAKADADCEELKTKAEGRMKDARRLIVGRVVGH